jgi:soluble lytic murein transglycosylase
MAICLGKIIPARWCKRALVAFAALALCAAAASELARLVRAYRGAPTPERRAAIEAYAGTHPDEEALARLALGVAAYEQKDYAAAISELAALPARLPLIADYPAYYQGAARVELYSPKCESGLDCLLGGVPQDLAVAHNGPLSPFSGKARLLEARALKYSAPARAVETLRAHYSELPQPDGDLALAESYQAADDPQNAAEFYQRAYAQYPLGPAADQASAALAALQVSMGSAFPQPLPEQLLLRADRLFELHAYPQARAEYAAAIDRLTGVQRDEARVRVGASDLAANNFSAAYSYLTGLRLDESEADAERLYYIEEAARRLNNDDAAAGAVRRLAERYPKSGWRAKALFSLANRYLVANRSADYLPLYKTLYSDFPENPNAATAHWKIAFYAYLHNENDAEGLLRAHLEKYADHATAAAALYFLGRLYERKNDHAAARACYEKLIERLPNTYYAMLARGRLNAPEIATAAKTPLSENTAAFLGALHFSAPAEFPSQPSASTTLRIDRSRLLRAAGLSDLADSELRFGAHNGAQPTLMAMEIAGNADAPYQGLVAMKALAPDYIGRPLKDAPRQFWEYLFPLPYRAELTADSQAYNLDPYAVAGLIRQESEFNPGAVSSANADGLMQVEPGTARDMARAAGILRFAPNMLFQPATNLKIGTAVFRSMLDQNGGSLERTLAAYNAGPRHAADWWSWNNYREPAEFVESIPFTETRDYVQAVIRNSEMYRRLYAAQ